jgi:hypothetical protein
LCAQARERRRVERALELESRVLSRIEHPHIVGFRAAQRLPDGRLGLVLEACECSLYGLIQVGSPPPIAAATLAAAPPHRRPPSPPPPLTAAVTTATTTTTTTTTTSTAIARTHGPLARCSRLCSQERQFELGCPPRPFLAAADVLAVATGIALALVHLVCCRGLVDPREDLE